MNTIHFLNQYYSFLKSIVFISEINSIDLEKHRRRNFISSVAKSLMNNGGLIFCGILNIICGCSDNLMEANRDIVIICDTDDVYQERFYFIDGKENGAYMMDSNPVTFTIRNATFTDTSKIIRKVTSDILTIENDADRLFIHYEYNPLESFDFFAEAEDSIRIKRVDGMPYLTAIEVKDDLELLNNQGDTLMFDDLRKSLSGKVLYVDVWASWCEPCKREMPYSHELAKSYSDEDVVFLYLAWNDTQDKWEKAGNNLSLNEIGKSFLVLNSKDNLWKKQMNINTIPRYMIYDRNGNLVNSNAPRPSSDEIRKALDELIVN